jgi:hypothetical protein
VKPWKKISKNICLALDKLTYDAYFLVESALVKTAIFVF